MSMTDKIHETLEIIKGTDIYGCITGSCMLDADFDTWDSEPDIDIFVYSETAMIHAMITLEHLGFVPGGKDKKPAGETLKRNWLIESGIQRNVSLSTIMYEKDGVYLNVTYKKNCTSVIDVISGFDMSIIMIGYDIPTHYLLDLRCQDNNDPMIATPNKLKRQMYNHPSRFTVWRALHQWDRVPKYYGRGYDTRPMAKFYLDIIDEVLEAGAAFGTEKDMESFNEMEPGFIEVYEKITKWYDEHKED